MIGCALFPAAKAWERGDKKLQYNSPCSPRRRCWNTGEAIAAAVFVLALILVMASPAALPFANRAFAASHGIDPYTWFERVLGHKAGFIYSGPLRLSRAKVPTWAPVVALTFDDGPDPRYTMPILAILRDEGVRATFFDVGQNALEHPELVREELAQGDEVGNHTFSHPNLRYAPYDEVKRQMTMGEDAIARVSGGKRPVLFRPPFGEFNPVLVPIAQELGYRVILWSIGVENHAAHTPEQMVNRILTRVQPGDIILLHDGRLDRTRTVLALRPLIEQLKARGYQFVTLSEMLDQSGRTSGRASLEAPAAGYQ